MNAEKAKFLVERIFRLARGESYQGDLWALRTICKTDQVFLTAISMAPKDRWQALKFAMKDGRKKIEMGDIRFAKAKRNGKKPVQLELFAIETIKAPAKAQKKRQKKNQNKNVKKKNIVTVAVIPDLPVQMDWLLASIRSSTLLTRPAYASH